jgi:hypothetical protein
MPTPPMHDLTPTETTCGAGHKLPAALYGKLAGRVEPGAEGLVPLFGPAA